jgi:tetratricopeptide (TPR) repeat protein
LLTEIHKFKDSSEKKKSIQRIVKFSINFSNKISESGDYFDAGEFLYSAAEILEELNFSNALELYKHNIKLWEKLIDNFTIQAKLHEIAEIYLKIADIYGDKLKNIKAQNNSILKSIYYLKQEINLIKDFSETGNIESRKLAQNYQNIADLYLKSSDFKNAIKFYKDVIELAKIYKYYDLLSFSYQQIASCYEELDDYTQSKDIILEGVDFFSNLFHEFEEKNENLALSQICQILKNLYNLLNDKDQFVNYSKKEAGAYINLAEDLEKRDENFQKIARYYRGAGLCYLEIDNNLIECASCFILAGNYSEKIEDYNETAINFFDAANVFKEINNFQMAYKHFVKAGDNFWKINNLNQSTENYLNAYDIAVEGNLKFNRFGIFNQIIRGLNKIAKEGLKNKQFFIAATLILESIKFYEQLDIAKDFFLREMVRNVYKYYYRAANLKKIGYSHIVQSYVLASLSSILNGKLGKAREIISELDSEGKTINIYKEMIELIIEWVSNGTPVKLENFPYNLRRIIEGSEEILYLLKLFRSLQPPISMLS